MLDFLPRLFSSHAFMPHGHCYLWTPGLVWLHVVADALIALAYYSIPITLVWFARRRPDLNLHWIFGCFAVFIFACGTAHLMEIWNVWHGSYWLSGACKALTAAASIPTAILLTRLGSRALNLPSPVALQQANASLREEITARRAAEERAACEKDYYLTILDKFPVPVWRSDVHGGGNYFNQTWLEFTGRTVEQELGQRWTEGVHPVDHVRCLKTYHEAFDLRRPLELEYRLRRHDGEYRWILDHGRPFHDLDGQFAGYLGFCYDITERKRAEEVSALLAAIVDSSFDAIIGKDLHGIVKSWNAGAERMFGYSAGEMIGRSITVLIPPDRQDDEQMILARIRRGEAAEHFETVRMRKDGGLINVSVTVSPIKDARGEIVGASKVARDITGRKLAEEALRASEAKFRRLSDSNIIGMISWSVPGIILEANDLFLQMVGYTREDLQQGQVSWKKLTPPEYSEVSEKALAELAAAGACAPFEKEYIRKDGSRVSVLIGAALFEAQKDVGIGFVLDITERKHAEDALRTLSHRLLQAEDEERRRIAKELHDSTAQDLVAVMMNLGAIGEGAKGAGEIMADTLAILENCVNDIRTLSYVLHPPRLHEDGLAGALTEYAAGVGRRAAIPVRVELPPDLDRLPEEIELALFRVVQESLANVLRHSKSETATIRLLKKKDAIALEVIDHGRGLPPATTASSLGALGVGIAGMRERMQHFGGRLELDSSAEGMTVRAILPLAKKAK